MEKKVFIIFVLVIVALIVVSWTPQEVATATEEEYAYTLYLPLVVSSGSQEPVTCGFREGTSPEGEILLAGEIVTGPAMVVPRGTENIAVYAIYPGVDFTISSLEVTAYLYDGNLNCLELQYPFFWQEVIPVEIDSVEPEPQPEPICEFRQPEMGENPAGGIYLEGDIIGPAIVQPIMTEGSTQVLLVLTQGATEHLSIPTLTWLYHLESDNYCLARQLQYFPREWYKLWIFPEP